MKKITTWIVALFSVLVVNQRLNAQAEVSGWGNLRGIRVGGQLVEFTTAVGIYNPDFSQATLSQREGPVRTSRYVRDGNTVTVGENLQFGARGGRGGGGGFGAPGTRPATNPAGGRGFGGRGGLPTSGFTYVMSYADTSPGVCSVQIQLTSVAAQNIGGVFYFLNFPATQLAGGSVEIIEGANSTPTVLGSPDEQGRYLAGNGGGVRISGKNGEQVEVDFASLLDVVVQRGRGAGSGEVQIYFPIISGKTTAGQNVTTSFTIKAAGEADTSPATVTIDPVQTGRTFLGMGGNYRIQNQRLDPIHIQYIMDHMRVAYGRVAMPWNAWQPREDAAPPMMSGAATEPATEPTGQQSGRGGGAMNSLSSAMEMAQKLAKQDIPMIISDWQPPSWAVISNGGGGRGFGGGGGPRGQRLDPAKWDDICKSIGSYLVYLRDHYGAEPELFSFNESNIGINVRQTPEDHDEAIKKLGAYFKSIGLKTKMLLGDTGDAPPVSFIGAALADPEAKPYIGAVSFHSWRGATDEQYQKWADAATKLGVPLIDAEGGNDAQASSYSNIFREQWYSLDEAAEYVRIMRICQPEAILEWQLTENYSVLYTDEKGELHPTQRFYNLKQLNLTPAGSAWIACKSNNNLVLPAAFADKAKNVFTVHLVNNGPSRPVTVSGLPASVTQLNVYVTDHEQGMAKRESVGVSNGSAQFKLAGQALTTLISGEPSNQPGL